ncbi:MAG: hypothetical protein ACI4T9_13015 [Prevotella sp.]
MRNTTSYITFSLLIASMFIVGACQSDSSGSDTTPMSTDGNVIHIGGISTDDTKTSTSATRATSTTDKAVDAETIDWLVKPLESGLDITYGSFDNSGKRTNKRVALLKLLTNADGSIKYSDEKLAEYSFNYVNEKGNETSEEAKWYGNGQHFFEGSHVPESLRLNSGATTPAATDLSTDQHDDTPGTAEGTVEGNYALLAHYLSMPANFTLNATVERIKLPFGHRLARVLAYILIDPKLNTTIKGFKCDANGNYTGTEDATTSSIRFCNVKVLQSVTVTANGDHNDFTPNWTEARKVIPHYVGERGSFNDNNNTELDSVFVMFYNNSEKKYISPTDEQWSTLNALTYDATTETSTDGNYKRTEYGRVPVYDIIVRPTYTDAEHVVYDEKDYATNTSALSKSTNKIDFDITLSNGLKYTKTFEFDLDANYETVVYLRIDREKVDYNSSGSQKWVNDDGSDGYYGVNNKNKNTLSLAGNSWQRAYTNKTYDPDVTDGHKYKADDEDAEAQYVSDAKWIEMFKAAGEGGTHQGDYFILDHDINLGSLPENFVFAGHLDAMDHQLTVDGRSYIFDGLNGTYDAPQETSGYTGDWKYNVHKERGKWVPVKGWRAEVLNLKQGASAPAIFKADATITGYVNNCYEGTTAISHQPSLPQY